MITSPTSDLTIGVNGIIIHEAAHEWWGNAVTVGDFSDIWLQEGFATYAEALYIERMYGKDFADSYIYREIATWVNNKLPVVGPESINFWDHKDNDVYHKGAMVLHTLRNAIDDSLMFFDILQTFYAENALKSPVSTEDFIEVVERKTGQQWDIFFDVYLHQRKIPGLEYYFAPVEIPNEDSAGVTVENCFFGKWINVPEGFTMPVDITQEDLDYIYRTEIGTEPTFYFADELDFSKEIQFNPDLSYFTGKRNTKLINDYLKSIEEGQ